MLNVTPIAPSTTKADTMTARGGAMTLDGGKRADSLTGGLVVPAPHFKGPGFELAL